MTHNLHVRIAVMPGRGGAGLLGTLGPDDALAAEPEPFADLAAAIAERERTSAAIRWVWPATRLLYPNLLRAGVRVARCHDVELTAALLAARDGHGDNSPQIVVHPGEAGEAAPRTAQLPFDADESTLHGAAEELAELVALHAQQQAGIRADAQPGKFALLTVAESAGGIVAAEMTAAGLPWRADIHDRLLTELLGPRPPVTGGQPVRPARLTELATQISAALDAVRPVNPDSPAQVLRALAASGIRVSSTRSAVLRQVDHPVIPLLLQYKELVRLYTANGWSWLDTWVSAGRFRPEYVVGGVVSGRWASRGGRRTADSEAATPGCRC
jgi:DNA polymerase-1